MKIFILQNLLTLSLISVIICLFSLGIIAIWRKRRAELQRDRIYMAVNRLFDGLIMIDESRIVIGVNSRAEEMLGIKGKEIVNKTFPKKPKDPYFSNLIKVISVMAEKGKEEWKDIVIEEPRNLVLRVTPIPIFDSKGKRAGFVFVLHDITREKEIDKIKSEFITVAAHKLRAPVSVVKWGIGLLTDGKEKLSSNQREILEWCYRANDRAIFEIDNLLSVSQLEKGLFKYKFRVESLEDIVAEAAQRMTQFAEKQEISLKYREPEKPLPKVRVDKDKISLVIHNLLDNALRYTLKGGKVLVKVREEDKFLVVSVRDTGIGISSPEQKRVFTKFFRSKRAMKIYTEGLGLNLFVIKNIIEKHHGKIWFESKENQGTTFYFKLPT